MAVAAPTMAPTDKVPYRAMSAVSTIGATLLQSLRQTLPSVAPRPVMRRQSRKAADGPGTGALNRLTHNTSRRYRTGFHQETALQAKTIGRSTVAR